MVSKTTFVFTGQKCKMHCKKIMADKEFLNGYKTVENDATRAVSFKWFRNGYRKANG
jgi:hypothetical protein